MLAKSALKRVLSALGYEIVRRADTQPVETLPADFTSQDRDVINWVQPYTLTSPERIHALIEATRYIVQHRIAGDIVECGVWRGGSMMAVARVLLELGDVSRDLWLFDTFDGMTPPTERDVRFDGITAAEILAIHKKEVPTSYWAYAPLAEVRQNLARTGYDSNKIHFVQGRVEDTLPEQAPQRISLLRLDTDWYESTYHELRHLFPRLSSGGVLIIDDYGWFKGCRQATDEYIQEHDLRLLLVRIDHPGRVAVKP
jgi:O-methyltransferase